MFDVKKFGSVIALTTLLGISSATAGETLPQGFGTFCFQDPSYPVTTLQLEVSHAVLFGEAQYSGWENNGAITGSTNEGVLRFAIAYPTSGLRFYEVAIGSWAGRTWGVTTPPAGFYDTPHFTVLKKVPCSSEPETDGPSGAAE